VKIRNIDLGDNAVTQEHQALHIPPPENSSNSSVINAAIGVVFFALITLVVLGVVELFKGSWAHGIGVIDITLQDDMFWKAFFVGLLAQTIDGALGMAYGITSTSFLLATGASPALASASVHMAEVFTTGASGVAHARLGNVDKKLFIKLLFPGVLGGITGAIVVTQIDGSVLKPYITAYLLVMGIYVFSKAFRKKIVQQSGDAKHVAKLAFLGGFVDTSGGGGWGPVVTTTLVGTGHNPRMTIGTVNFAEFFLTLASAASLFVLVDESIWHVVVGLIFGGLLAAPFAAVLCKKIPARGLLILVGLLIVAISLFNFYKLL
jgi:uncharacterized protein